MHLCTDCALPELHGYHLDTTFMVFSQKGHHQQLAHHVSALHHTRARQGRHYDCIVMLTWQGGLLEGHIQQFAHHLRALRRHTIAQWSACQQQTQRLSGADAGLQLAEACAAILQDLAVDMA